jgi:GMP synthase-like glutamine amidotransferase
VRALTPRALHILNEQSGPARLFVDALEERGIEVVTVDPSSEALPPAPDGYAAIVSGGGTADAHQTDIHPWLVDEAELLRAAVRDGVPTMGLCLGAQLLTQVAGGSVYRCEPAEVGWYEVETAPDAADDPVLAALPARFTAMQWHYYACEPAGPARAMARTPVCAQAIKVGEAAWGTQFHIEVTRDILVSWLDAAPQELERFGYDHAAFLDAVDRHLPAHEAIGRDMAARFAEVALQNSRSTL